MGRSPGGNPCSIERQQDVTPAVLEVMERTRDPRLREIMISLIKHLHGFVRDVRLTEAEFREATAILNEMGKLTTDTHNEPVLMAGSLGVSSLVCLLNNGDHGNTETSQSLLGPFWRLNSPRTPNGGTIIRSETPGDPLFVNARVQDQAGQSDRRRRGRHLARLSDRLVREPGPRAGRVQSARQIHDRRGRPLLVPLGQDGRLSYPDRRRRRTPPQGAGPPPLPSGASSRADLQAGVQGPDLAGLRPARPPHRHATCSSASPRPSSATSSATTSRTRPSWTCQGPGTRLTTCT